MKNTIWKLSMLAALGLFTLAVGCAPAGSGSGSSAGTSPTQKTEPTEEKDIEIPVIDTGGNN